MTMTLRAGLAPVSDDAIPVTICERLGHWVNALRYARGQFV